MKKDLKEIWNDEETFSALRPERKTWNLEDVIDGILFIAVLIGASILCIALLGYN